MAAHRAASTGSTRSRSPTRSRSGRWGWPIQARRQRLFVRDTEAQRIRSLARQFILASQKTTSPGRRPFMTTSNVEPIALTPAEHQLHLRRAVIPATIGTSIEWYDFFLYSTVTGLIFAKLFFPHSDPWVGTLEEFAIYAVGFLARPVGAAIFGHFGDRIGRKSTLIATLLLMGLATSAVALVPTYASIGVWGAVILTVLRFIQGVGVGGEWGGSVLMSMQWARNNQSRG